MTQKTAVPWEALSDYVLSCGSIHEPYRFCVNALQSMRSLVDFDQGVFLMFDGNRRIVRKYFYNFPKRWSSLYLDWYSHATDTDFSLDQEYSESRDESSVKVIDWKSYDWWGEDQLEGYIEGRGLGSSLTFTLFDLMGAPATSFSLDRMSSKAFSELDVATVRVAAAHLNNLYKNLFVRPAGQVRLWDGMTGADSLTPRERQVLELLCEGVTPNNIARDLHISLGTTNKHIGHIYQKLEVSNRQELLVRLLGK